MCAYNGYANIARTLLDHGAELDIVDVSGNTPENVAEVCGHSFMVTMFQKYRASSCPGIATSGTSPKTLQPSFPALSSHAPDRTGDLDMDATPRSSKTYLIDKHGDLLEIGSWIQSIQINGISRMDFMSADLYALFNREWDPEVKECAGGASHTSKGGRRGPSSSRGSGNSGQGNGAKKTRKRCLGDGGDGNEDPKRPKSVPNSPTASAGRFACPFYKNNSQFYKADKKYTICAVGEGFRDIARLK
jgi:hypothetical protein